ncbi:MAG: hypothetical protein A2268_16825 [Candidatus Raymondbacteria bacterium RifOxyA12_full_50_37]|uniref:DUF3078 domain-containing protein n=1 Tax=Candidatus Raymondbacteria bacterium RIFOXYD12_FULL_49_13 TaxID=1817890 RepID=A0A1F7FCH0_UNCRA|nr:MAG: hypothetical protein A2268_16825 [Candidatus Raymondbacteria bacterium RifOxyA12_full_50_37]OGJ86274.1 MAG: hypothetical protein A2248_16420 [Candidatus Raymondbacteria bacterium RIFOXYA2_FULL_49_16]OGJ93622.1 MAG: hypothetical protein A2487_20190 [Candidatus Raymondbacteria bacterium RifOxyC12_full_50_8]OGJ95811.1 MAG: hypothetical protein A2453_11735 [Candidatus Raymondbacteria bacterium RIFOXYC2_FULL_50_21]OGJ99058.1 MAG: hypothetical protein A2350_17345 [Candidatus Raymondbacteria b
MKTTLTSITATVLVLALTLAYGAEPWKLDINANVTTTINSYSDSWIGGEAGSFTWGSQFIGIAERQLQNKLNTKTTLKLQFGQTKVQNNTTKRWGAPEKSTDLIDAEELLRYTTGAWFDPFASARVISQFQDNRDALIVRYVNPLDITEALGVSRTLRKNDIMDWSTRIGVAARQLVDRKHLDPANGKRTTDVTNDGGLELSMNLKAENAQKWLKFLSSLTLYEALLSSKAEEAQGTVAADYWRYPHLKWENSLSLSLAKYIMLNVSAYAFYDRDISNKLRLKEIFSVGLTYNFSKK